MEKPYVEFRRNGKVLCQYTIEGTFAGEKEATIELLASEQGCSKEEIEAFRRNR